MSHDNLRPPSPLTTESGSPDSQHAQTAGAGSPMLVQDQQLLEKLAHFNRERIPGRVVHANGFAAYGPFEVTRDATRGAPFVDGPRAGHASGGGAPLSIYRRITEPERVRLIASIGGSLVQVTRKEIIDRSIGHFRRADPEYGAVGPGSGSSQSTFLNPKETWQ